MHRHANGHSIVVHCVLDRRRQRARIEDISVDPAFASSFAKPVRYKTLQLEINYQT
jgi:hypothetical protein